MVGRRPGRAARPATVAVSPAAGTKDVDVLAPVTVTATGGTLTAVTMTDDAGAARQGTGERSPLGHAAGDLPGAVLREGREAHELEQLLHAGPARGAVQPRGS